jgi:hypothetical protein
MWTFGEDVAELNNNGLYRVWLAPNFKGKFVYEWQRVIYKGRKLNAQEKQIADGLWTYVPAELKV